MPLHAGARARVQRAAPPGRETRGVRPGIVAWGTDWMRDDELGRARDEPLGC